MLMSRKTLRISQKIPRTHRILEQEQRIVSLDDLKMCPALCQKALGRYNPETIGRLFGILEETY